MLRLREEVFEYGLFPLPQQPSASLTHNQHENQNVSQHTNSVPGQSVTRFTYANLLRMTRKFFEGGKKTSSAQLPYRHWIKAATQLLKIDSFYAKL